LITYARETEVPVKEKGPEDTPSSKNNYDGG